MKFGEPSTEYFAFLAGVIRRSEIKKAGTDKIRLAEIEASSDNFLVMRFLWAYSIIGGPITFIAIPVLLSGLAPVAPHSLMSALWFLSRGAMGIIFILFLIAVFASRRQNFTA
jgi:hypothetical protein